MKTILDILVKVGECHPGLCLKIENTPYMEFVIEAMDKSGPCGLPALSVCRYSEVNGDLMRDPEMCFELSFAGERHLTAYYYRNDFLGRDGEPAALFYPQSEAERHLTGIAMSLQRRPRHRLPLAGYAWFS
ncbi:DUF6908 domain-containing protein [Edaphobacter albus]|uniref:DUF6908 domain-containing protein n=1 Tax=Edaphobacter sp. 4G125 TaxID=2763071 RepID=UPI0016490BC0|nr:hypothetical protein [Edaphobacter sp. 4G125]QNI35878.1 hypothetical protein H7846_12670 [Edaphobacter sp. 4G125]